MPLAAPRFLRPLAIAILAFLPSATAQAAVVGNWTAVKVRGTVVYLVGSQWQEFSRGDAVSDGQAVRTLQSGRLQLQRGKETISLGPNTAVEIDRSQQGSLTTVRQYSGSVVIVASPGGGEQLTVETPVLAVATVGGVISVAFDGATAEVKVDSGSVSVVDLLNGSEVELVAGQAVTNSAAAGMDFSGSGTLPTVVAVSGDGVAASGDAGVGTRAGSGADSGSEGIEGAGSVGAENRSPGGNGGNGGENSGGNSGGNGGGSAGGNGGGNAGGGGGNGNNGDNGNNGNGNGNKN
jgi:hypothetical protein